jgi:GWxTD domain-containing protein
MKYLLALCAGCLALLLSVPCVRAQADMEPAIHERQMVFYYDAIPFSTGDSTNSRVDVYLQLAYDQLNFVKSGKNFVAKYEVTATVLTDNQRTVMEKSWPRQIEVADYDQSVSKKYYDMSQRSLMLQPGSYILRLQVSDIESKRTALKNLRLNVPDYVHHLSELSGLMIINSLVTDTLAHTIVPQLSWNVGNLPKGFSLFFEYYPTGDPDSVRFVYTLFDQNNEQLFHGMTNRIVKAKKFQVFIPIDSLDIPMGTYSLRVESTSWNKNKLPPFVSTIFHAVVIQWNGIPISINDMDEAIQQLKYIATAKDMDELENAQTGEEKRKALAAFWKKRDPTPLTEENEKMTEFYLRVEFANKHFSQFRKGWKTDMGMIYIIFGPPNNIERHPFEISTKPYEIWSYYDINFDFIFMDYDGFGNFIIMNPNWEMWSRVPR